MSYFDGLSTLDWILLISLWSLAGFISFAVEYLHRNRSRNQE